MEVFYEKEGNNVIINIPSGKMVSGLDDNDKPYEYEAKNWQVCIAISDTQALKQYLTDEQIKELL